MNIGSLAAFAALALVAAAVPFQGCGDNENENGGAFLVYANGTTLPGDACPSGTTEAYRDGQLLVCHSCTTNAHCDAGSVCRFICGPGCEDDLLSTRSCCVVRDCVEIVG